MNAIQVKQDMPGKTHHVCTPWTARLKWAVPLAVWGLLTACGQEGPGAKSGTATQGAAGGSAAVAPVAAGEKLYQSVCQTCHATGTGGAPRLGDKNDWAPRLAQGDDVLFKHTIEGFTGNRGVMPPRGGSNASDAELRAAVLYMTQGVR